MNSETVLMRMPVILGIVSLAFLAGCGGAASQSLNNQLPSGSNATPTITTISPNTTVAGGAAFTLTITGTNFVAGSMVSFGGTAPATTFVSATQLTAAIPAAAIASAGTAAVTVTNPAPGGGTSHALNFTITSGTNPVTVTVSPASVTVQPGAVQQFTATVSPNGMNQAVSWTVSGTGCMGESCGTIDPTGKYTAPATVANPLTVTVTAISAADPSKSASAMVTVMVESSANNAGLSGQYALLLSGFAGSNPVAGVGSFIADGNGNLVAGSMDVTSGNAVFRRALANSTYSVGSDNRGVMNLNFAVVPGPDLFFTFSFALDSFSPAGLATRGRLINSTPAGMSGTGFFVKQDPAAFSTAAINDGFAFGLMGPQGIDENVALGRFTASGGSFSAGHIDLVGFGNTSGLRPDQSFTGTYSVDGSGRGEATLNISGQPNPLGLVLYVVSSGESLWMDSGGSGVTGMALQQSGGPFNASSLNGTAVFGAAGFTVAGNDVTVGEVQFDGMGNLSGTNDENYFGLSFSHAPITGTYTVDSNGLGRGSISEVKGPGLSVFYLVSPDRGFILSGNDSLEFGTFEPQTGSPFTNASLSGSYALGTIPLLSSPRTSLASGVLSADGVGNLSGTLTTKTGTETFMGNYSVAANGRTILSITPTSGSPSNLVFYLVSASKAVGAQTTNFGPPNAAVNVIEK